MERTDFLSLFGGCKVEVSGTGSVGGFMGVGVGSPSRLTGAGAVSSARKDVGSR